MAPEERSNFLADECGDDASLRAGVERLVAAHERANQLVQALELVGVAVIPATGESLDESAAEPVSSERRFGPYRVIRELGRGGMGVVYLAERIDGHGKQVAIKLIERAVDVDLLHERLRAERMALASLDHPNVGRLLDGGTTEEGFPYFVMEYVDGEPLDEYADAYRLSVPDRLKLFLQVTSAVAHAHRYRIVHRDIKPANILVTPGGLPKLLDFGIANVLDPDGDEHASSDLRLLTPEYASPEQVEGRHATPVSDVYSLGVVLYELLTGQSPYRVRTREPLDVSQAVRTIDPERPSKAVTRDVEVVGPGKRRAGLAADRAAATSAGSTQKLGRRLSGDLDTIVLKALRKTPSQRYQSVEQLAADVRLHLEGRPVTTQADNVGYRTGKFLQRNRTPLSAVVLVLLVAAAFGGGFLAFQANARPAEPPVALGLLAPRDRIVVANLADSTGDPALATALSDAFRVDLTQSPFAQVLFDRQVRSALVRMDRAANDVVDSALARKIAVREGVKAVVTGTISKVAAGYAITAQLVSAEKGGQLASVREMAVDSTDVIRAIDRLSDSLRRQMGESLGSIQATPQLEQVTTSSLAALRSYSDGVHAISGGNRARGLQLLEQAVALDTGFASAYRVAGLTYGDMGDAGRATSSMTHAVANQSRLAFYERYHTVGSYAYTVLHDNIIAIDAYQRILDRYPNDVRALINLGHVYSLRREYAVQESLLVRALAVDSTMPSISTALVGTRVNRGNFTGARLELDRVAKRYPNLSNTQLAESYIAGAQQDWASAERWARSRLSLPSTDVLDSLDGLQTLADIMMAQGRIAEAAQESRAVLALGAKLGSRERYLSAAVRLAYIELRYRNAPSRARATVNTALRRFPLDKLQEGDRPYDLLARFFVAAGDVGRARDLMLHSDQTTLGRQRAGAADRRWTLGVLSLARGQFPEAVAQLLVAAEQHECPICALPDLARAYEAVGKPDSSIAVYERYLHEPWERRFETDATELGSSMRRLAELYESRRETAKAAEQYATLVSLWNRADPELGPVIEEVRKQLTRMGEVTGQRD
jgi:serine/threonine protein kinase/tetratricopeptide (TPR) repeat protein